MWHKDMVADLSSGWSYFTSVDPGIPFSFRVAVAVNEFLRAWHNDMFDFICLYLSHDRNAQLREKSLLFDWKPFEEHDAHLQLHHNRTAPDHQAKQWLEFYIPLNCLKLDTLGVWVLNMIRLEKIYSTTKSQSPWISPRLHGINMYQPHGDATIITSSDVFVVRS